MDYKKLAEIVFPNIYKDIAYLEEKFPERQLKEGAKVTRFAPSPTGYMHIGGLYVSIICERISKQSGGVFYLRIEDTDKKRQVEGGIDEIISALAKFDIKFDEGPFDDGSSEVYKPYCQSQRKEIYQICAKELMKKGLAYPCFCTAEELAQTRAEQEENKLDMGYYGRFAKCRELSLEQVEKLIDEGKPFVVRLKSQGDKEQSAVLFDQIKGKIEMPQNIMDIVILKSDGIPTYHFAHAVDDHFMRTNLVVRGDEWLSSFPVHEELFRSLGFKLPKYAHIAPIMKIDAETGGKRKISKRKDPEASVTYYAEMGYPKESVIEYLLNIANSAFEEWRIKSPEKPYDEYPFKVKNIPTSGALFDMVKLDDVSREVVSKKTDEQCAKEITEWAEQYDQKLYNFINNKPQEFLNSIALWKRAGKKVRKDVAKWSELITMFDYIYTDFNGEIKYEFFDEFDRQLSIDILEEYQKVYDAKDDANGWFEKVKQITDKLGLCSNMKEYKKNPENYKGSVADVSCVIRVAVTGKKNSPDLYTIIGVIGSDEMNRRIENALKYLKDDSNF